MSDVFLWKVGKHAGRPITELPADFLEWVVTEAERIFPESKQAAARELGRRKVEGAPERASAVEAAANPPRRWTGTRTSRR